ncbi:MAG: apolipoprotein N-acyltransferase, partial [Methanosarcinaceae archaeon]|nr:apolipoprotein N-acyltransferase [Methanosarcinaceae archaeon]
FYGGLLWWAPQVDGMNQSKFSLVLLVGSCYFGLFGLFAYYFNKKIPQWNALTFSTTWVLLEYLCSHLSFLSCPWGILGYSQYCVPSVAGISAFTGVYGVSFIVIVVNTVLAELIHPYLSIYKTNALWTGPVRNKKRIPLYILTVVLVMFFVYFLYGMPFLKENGNISNLKVGIVQGNVYFNDLDDLNYRKTVLQKYSRLTSAAVDFNPELILWPSSSVPGKIPADRTLVRLLSDLAKKTRSFLLIGSSGYDKLNAEQRRSKKTANSAFLLTPQGKIVGRYDKIMLLPFDEYLPLRGYMKWPSWIINSDWVDAKPGKELTIFSMDNVRFGVMICWENMFPDLFRKMAAKGVDFMVSMTNEGFTDNPSPHYQMLAMNVFRAIENRISIVRTASTGVSAIVDPTGVITAKVEDNNKNDVNVEGYIVGQLPLSRQRSFYNRHGDWFVYSLFVIFIAFIFLALLDKRHLFREKSQ